MTKTAGELVLIPIATTIAESVTHPIDYVKTRRQVDGKGGSSFLQVARATYARGGVAAFYPSLVFTILIAVFAGYTLDEDGISWYFVLYMVFCLREKRKEYFGSKSLNETAVFLMVLLNPLA